MTEESPFFFSNPFSVLAMTTPLLSQVLDLHRHYNQIGKLQQSLPLNKPRSHSNHADKEQRVVDKAREVAVAARTLLAAVAGTEYESQVDNIFEGCRIMQDKPYERLGGIVEV
jgi:hypothetical protein